VARILPRCFRALRVVLLLAAPAGLIAFAIPVRLLYQDGVELHLYQSPAENILITNRLAMALWVLPAQG
jgi:hypothetical protein